MKLLKIAAVIGVGVGLIVALVAPIGPLPGFFIGGTPSEPPAEWGEIAYAHEIELKAPGSLPRVVVIWMAEDGGDLYVLGAKNSGWGTRIGDSAPVEVRIGANTYALQASRTTQGWQPVLDAYMAKYTADYPDIVASMHSAAEAADIYAVFRLHRG